MPADYRIGVAGLRDLRRELKRAGDQFPKELRDTNLAVAEVVAAAARRNAQTQRRVIARKPRPSRQHWVDYVQTIRALASQTRATVALGAARVPWALGQNFGSINRKNFPPQTDPDYALYKAIGAQRERVIEEYGDMIQKLTSRAFPD